MSELIHTNDNHATIRWKLLTSASALALTAYVVTAGAANADDAARPTIWIELGGQMEQLQGLNAPFLAPFMSVTPTPDIYKGISFTGTQKPPLFAFGADGKISFQPENSDWVFSAAVRYGRSHSKRHLHHQSLGHVVPLGLYYFTSSGQRVFPSGYSTHLATVAFVDVNAPSEEHHLVLDFKAGKDVGIGLFGHDGTSNISAGVREMQFSENSSLTIYARPQVGTYNVLNYPIYYPKATFSQYTLTGHAKRSFKGIGPSLSWNASAGIAGNVQDGELMLDWGINAALLFGKQKAKTDHSTMVRHFDKGTYTYSTGIYPSRSYNAPTRSRSITVPNIEVLAGLSWRTENAKVSIGYRYDTYLKALDTGIDARKTSNLTFNGPYASISIGIGD